MTRAISLFLLAGILLSAAGGCGKRSTFDPNATVTASYASISSVILSPGCVSCHGGAGGYSFDSYAGTATAVTAGNVSGSKLYQVLSTGRMPPDGPQPGVAQLQAIAQWITDGAKNN